jgi:hypothetical protein
MVRVAFNYFALGRTIKTTSAMEAEVQSVYDSMGRLMVTETSSKRPTLMDM